MSNGTVFRLLDRVACFHNYQPAIISELIMRLIYTDLQQTHNTMAAGMLARGLCNSSYNDLVLQ